MQCPQAGILGLQPDKVMIVMLHEICVFSVHHESWRHFLRKFVDTTAAPVIHYGDCKARLTRHSIGLFLGDQQVHIAYFVIYCIFRYFCIFGIFRNSIR